MKIPHGYISKTLDRGFLYSIIHHMQIFKIGVIGGSKCNSKILRLAEEVGEEIAKRGAVLICGGLGGVMEAACKGAKNKGGTTVGILPGIKKESANQHVDIPIVTGLGEARNVIIVRSSDGLIAVDGRYGTLSEIAFALRFEKPLVGLHTWNVDEHIIKAETPEEGIEKLFEKMKGR